MMPVAEMSVLLAIQYSRDAQELENGSIRQIQFLLMPQECLELADLLTRQGKRLLESPPKDRPLM